MSGTDAGARKVAPFVKEEATREDSFTENADSDRDGNGVPILEDAKRGVRPAE